MPHTKHLKIFEKQQKINGFEYLLSGRKKEGKNKGRKKDSENDCENNRSIVEPAAERDFNVHNIIFLYYSLGSVINRKHFSQYSSQQLWTVGMC